MAALRQYQTALSKALSGHKSPFTYSGSPHTLYLQPLLLLLFAAMTVLISDQLSMHVNSSNVVAHSSQHVMRLQFAVVQTAVILHDCCY
jgi:hypothetical protein